MTFLNYFQHPLFSFRIPFLFFLGFVEKYKRRSKGVGIINIVTNFNIAVKLEVWGKKNSLFAAGNEIRKYDLL